MRSFISLLAFATGVSFAMHAYAQTDNPAWLDELTEQLALQEQCEVAFFVRVQEDEIGGLKSYISRAQCVDGRQFDASRTERETDFTIRACVVEVC